MTERSQILLQRLIAEKSHFGQSFIPEGIDWVSPVAPDFSEYRDGAFLERLQLEGQVTDLNEFWPTRGPMWDGLGIARSPERTRILVEAKGYIEEADTTPTQAKEGSRQLIVDSLMETKSFLKAGSGKADWTQSFYQYANRLAHLYFLSVKKGIPTELWFIYFCNLDDEYVCTSRAEWKGALRLLNSHLGLNLNNPLKGSIREIFVDAHNLEVMDDNPKT